MSAPAYGSLKLEAGRGVYWFIRQPMGTNDPWSNRDMKEVTDGLE